MTQERTYNRGEAIKWAYPNYWDLAALCLVLGIIVLLVWGAKQMATPYQLGEPLAISLDPHHLAYYSLRTVLRMLLALCCSLLFTFVFATWAAKSKHAERIIIPMIDILQSVPVLAFLSVTVPAFIALFPGSLLGPECAAIFAIFTAQAWNMALSFYQSVRSVPSELREAGTMFRLSAWQRFWRVDVPFAMPGLLWNTMVSMSASWFFVVASEAISVANQNITLPGIGSYIALAIKQMDRLAILYAIIAMLIVIFLYDQLLFRPLISWSDKFKAESAGEEVVSATWLMNLFGRTRWIRQSGRLLEYCWDRFINFSLFNRPIIHRAPQAHAKSSRYWTILFYSVLFILVVIAATLLFHTIFVAVPWQEGVHVLLLGAITGVKVMVLIVLCSCIWIPVGVWIGMRGWATEIMQPVIQFIAAFPANLLFPIVVILIVKYHLNVNVWTAPLMILGTQWYILFNVIAGTSALPKELKQAAANLQLRGWRRWQRLYLPGIFPYYVTGAITAAGGAWNASIIAEVVSWGSISLQATGIGAYITQNATGGHFPRLALGIAVMTLYVLVINRLLWRPLYNLAHERFRIN